jgi:hypothetical protein
MMAQTVEVLSAAVCLGIVLLKSVANLSAKGMDD